MSGTADYIREAREQKGLTLRQVEEATRIPAYYLEILEGGGDDRLVSDRLYMVHFLRSYAAFLEVEEETLAAQFVRENRRPEPQNIVPVGKRRSWKSIAVAALAVLLLMAGGVYVYNPALVDIVGAPLARVVVKSTPPSTPSEAPAPEPSPIPASAPRADEAGSSVLQPEANETDPSKPRLVATPPAPRPEAAPVPVTTVEESPRVPATEAAAVSTAVQEAPAVPVAQETPASPTEEPATRTAAPDESPQQTAARGGDEADEANPSGTAAVAAATAPPGTAVAGTPAKHSLTITADAEAWLRVWVDDARPQDMLLAAGTSRTLSAQSGFVITFGNAGGVRLTLDGEELPAVGRSGQVVRGFKLPPNP